MALSSLTGITNAQLWDLCRKASPNFKSHTAKGTADLFTEKGFEALTRNDINVINEYFELSLRVGFQMLTSSRAKNPFADSGLVQIYDTPNGGFVQRIAVSSIKPVSPAFKGLEDYSKGGSSVDPYIVRKPESSERFFGQNFDYQSFITIQDYQVKTIFISEYGMGSFVAGIMEGLRNGYTIQEYENTLECLNKALNSTTYPLQDSQIINVDSWGSGTGGAIQSADLLSLIKNIKDVSTSMDVVPQTNAYNSAKFATIVDKSDLVLLMRAGIKTEMELKVELGAFNPDKISLPFAVKEVEHFGGLIPQDSNDYDMQPVYDNLGEVRGYIAKNGVTINGPAFWDAANNRWLVNITSGGATADTTFPAEPDHWYDPNSGVLAVLIQKGAIFENAQNPYIVKTIDNPRGLYRNYWASRPNNGINFDYYYTMVVFRKPLGED